MNWIKNFYQNLCLTLKENIAEKKWVVDYYLYNLTQRIEKRFYCKYIAILYGMYIGKHIGFRTRVQKIEC